MGRLSVFNKKQFKVPAQLFRDATLSDFGGGLNVVDNDITMKSKYSKVLDNFNRNVDGSNSLRWGTAFKDDVAGIVAGTIIELVYFNGHKIVFMSSGEIAKIDSNGTVTAIWNTAIAALLPGTPSAWATGLVVGKIDTSEFKGELIVVNGTDKPLIISKTITVKYLQDPATGSNVYVPIANYVTTVSNYLIMGATAASGSEIYISSEGTSGVWPGDASPNDSLSINIGSWVPENSGDIIGLGSFRNNLIVIFNGAIVTVELGVYDGLIHMPKVQDNIVQHGAISFRTTMTTKNDFVMADILGWHSALRTQFGLVDTKGLSELIDPQYIKEVPADANRKKAFSIYNRIENRFMTFLPSDTGAVVWTLSSSDKENIKAPAYSRYIGWDWVCGCASERGRVFFAKGTKIFQYGNAVYPDENYTADMVGEYDSLWVTATAYSIGNRVLKDGQVYIASEPHTSGTFANDLENVLWTEYLGELINFDWELPWSDINQRAKKKFLKAFQADTKGKAQFTFEVFVDNFYKDILTDEYIPAISMDFVAGDSLGFGGGDQPYGGGRRLRDERPWGTPAEFKLMKIRIWGSTRLPLQIVTLTILYYMGTFRR